MISNLIINGIYITLHYVDIQLNICSFWFCSLLFLYFEAKKNFQPSGKVMVIGCQLAGRRTPPTSLLTARVQQSGGTWMQKGPMTPSVPVFPFYEWGIWDPRKGVTCPKSESWASLSFFFLNTSLRVSSQSWGEWLHEWPRDVSTCTSHVCTTVSESVSACMNRQPEECPWNISRYFYQLLKLSRGTDRRQGLGKTPKWVLQGVKEQ